MLAKALLLKQTHPPLHHPRTVLSSTFGPFPLERSCVKNRFQQLPPVRVKKKQMETRVDFWSPQFKKKYKTLWVPISFRLKNGCLSTYCPSTPIDPNIGLTCMFNTHTNIWTHTHTAQAPVGLQCVEKKRSDLTWRSFMALFLLSLLSVCPTSNSVLLHRLSLLRCRSQQRKYKLWPEEWSTGEEREDIFTLWRTFWGSVCFLFLKWGGVRIERIRSAWPMNAAFFFL